MATDLVHARLSPSRSYQWLVCPASAAELHLSSLPTEASLRGDRLHYDAAKILSGEKLISIQTDRLVAQFVEYVLSIANGREIHTETTLHSLSIPDLFGTPDILLLGNTTTIVDLKTGKWPVTGGRNPQLKTYAYLASENFSPPQTYECIIFQHGKAKPAIYTPRTIERHGDRIKWANDNPDVFVPGEHCLFCPLLRRRRCPVGAQYAEEKDWFERYTHLQAPDISN